MADIDHNKLHDTDSTTNHTGVTGAVDGNLMQFNGNALPEDSDIVATTVCTISSQAGVPSSTPSQVGLINIDTTNDVAYISTGTASSSDWKRVLRIRHLIFQLVAATTDCATATNLWGDFTMPFSGTFLQSDTNKQWLMASNSTAGTTGTMVVDANLNGTSIMTTNKLDIETTEKTTETAATQPDLTTTSFTAGDILTFDIDSVHTTAAKGCVASVAVAQT